jgi:DNA-binding protein H-NS
MASYNEIRAQIAALEKQAEQVRAAEIETALNKVRTLIKDHNLSIADIGKKVFADGTGRKGTGRKGPGGNAPKYRDPATGGTWSGYGKRPGWISAAMKEGRGGEYLIDKVLAKPVKPAAKAVKPAAKDAKPAVAKKQAAKKVSAKAAN